MRWVVLTVAATALTCSGPAAAAAATERMSLACEGSSLVVERTNGASWWGSDGRTYTTKYLLVVDDRGFYEKHYGHTSSAYVVCEADHVVDGYESSWTVHLVPTS